MDTCPPALPGQSAVPELTSVGGDVCADWSQHTILCCPSQGLAMATAKGPKAGCGDLGGADPSCWSITCPRLGKQPARGC